ncbi:two-component sensor histidine kinase [Nocardia transvalensis]|nr:two-component sensor histidine kinase [Nocardia transvalensis]
MSATVQDVLIALLSFAVGAALYLSGLYPMAIPSPDRPLAVRFGVLALLCTATLLRRRTPMSALVFGLVPIGIDAVLGPTLPIWIIYSDLIYAACLYATRPRSRVVVVVCSVVMAAIPLAVLVATGNWRLMAIAFAAAFAFIGMPIWWALAVRHHKEMAEAEHARAQALELVAELDRRAAIADERKTMARDLHDVIAGHLSAIAIQSEAVLGLLARQDADPAVTGILGSIRSNSVAALQEMRAMIGLLRRDDGGADEAAAPRGLAQLPLLIDAARATGIAVRVRDSSDSAALPSVVDQAAYRIIQEGLTNAMKHAPGRAVDIAVDAEGDALTLSVCNPLPAPVARDGDEAEYARRGLINMRERAAALGGSLTAGPDDGGWVVRARLPLHDKPEVA